MKYNFVIEKTPNGYSAFEKSKPIFTTGNSIHQLQLNALEACQLFLENDSSKINLNNIAFEIDFKQFFEFYKIINAKHLAKRIGMNESLLSQYVTGKKKPSKKQVNRIIEGLHQIGKELTELLLVT